VVRRAHSGTSIRVQVLDRKVSDDLLGSFGSIVAIAVAVHENRKFHFHVRFGTERACLVEPQHNVDIRKGFSSFLEYHTMHFS
jgi:hypothetical protein